MIENVRIKVSRIVGAQPLLILICSFRFCFTIVVTIDSITLQETIFNHRQTYI